MYSYCLIHCSPVSLTHWQPPCDMMTTNFFEHFLEHFLVAFTGRGFNIVDFNAKFVQHGQKFYLHNTFTLQSIFTEMHILISFCDGPVTVARKIPEIRKKPPEEPDSERNPCCLGGARLCGWVITLAQLYAIKLRTVLATLNGLWNWKIYPLTGHQVRGWMVYELNFVFNSCAAEQLLAQRIHMFQICLLLDWFLSW